MNNSQYDAIIENHEGLNSLLNDKEVGVFSKFTGIDGNDDGFKAYISERYVDSFKTLFLGNLQGETQFKSTSALRTIKSLANDEVKERIIKEVLPILQSAHEKLVDINAGLQPPVKDTEAYTMAIIAGDALGHVTVGIFNELDGHPTIEEWRDKILSASFDACDKVAKASPKNETGKYTLYNILVNNVERINNVGALSERLKKHKGNIKGKRTGVEIKYVLYIIFFVLLLLFKLARIFMD